MKKALIVIDMQNDFIDGSLGTPEAKAIVLAVTEGGWQDDLYVLLLSRGDWIGSCLAL